MLNQLNKTVQRTFVENFLDITSSSVDSEMAQKFKEGGCYVKSKDLDGHQYLVKLFIKPHMFEFFNLIFMNKS